MLNIPNILTIFRIFLIPVLVILYYVQIPDRNMWVAGIFILAAVTDWLDGFLARELSAASKLGAFLDPVADKLIVSSALVLLVSDQEVLNRVLHETVFAIAVCIIIGREIVISALREWMAELGERGVVSVGIPGKVKTAFQMLSIAMLLYADAWLGLSIFRIGEILFYIAAVLTLWSVWTYLDAALPYLLGKPAVTGKRAD